MSRVFPIKLLTIIIANNHVLKLSELQLITESKLFQLKNARTFGYRSIFQKIPTSQMIPSDHDFYDFHVLLASWYSLFQTKVKVLWIHHVKDSSLVFRSYPNWNSFSETLLYLTHWENNGAKWALTRAEFWDWEISKLKRTFLESSNTPEPIGSQQKKSDCTDAVEHPNRIPKQECLQVYTELGTPLQWHSDTETFLQITPRMPAGRKGDI